MNDPTTLDPNNDNYSVSIQKYTESSLYTEDKPYAEDETANFEVCLSKLGYEDNQEIADTGMTKIEIRKAYFDLISSLSTCSDKSMYSWDNGGFYNLEWKYTDLDGDGVEEILFATSNSFASDDVGIGKIIDRKAVYCGELGFNGTINYYLGTGYFFYDKTIDDGYFSHTEFLFSLSGSEINLDAMSHYNSKDSSGNFIGESGVLHDTEVSAEEAQTYIDDIKNRCDDLEKFEYGDSESNISMKNLNSALEHFQNN